MSTMQERRNFFCPGAINKGVHIPMYYINDNMILLEITVPHAFHQDFQATVWFVTKVPHQVYNKQFAKNQLQIFQDYMKLIT